MDNRFYWRAEFETGDYEIDRDHIQVFEFANIVWNAVERGLAPQVIERALNAFVCHLADHIGREESVLAEMRSPLLGAQKHQHAKMLAQLRRLQDRTGKDDAALSDDFAVWIENSLVPHLVYYDLEAFRVPAEFRSETRERQVKIGER